MEIQVLEDFPSVQMPLEWLVQLVPPLKMRAFSISSSPSAHPNQVHLTVNVVSWTTPFKRSRAGLCSNWLAKLDPEQRMSYTVHIKHVINKAKYELPFHVLDFCSSVINRRLCSSVVSKRFPSSPTTITSSHSHWTWNWLCTFPWICGGKSHTKFDWFNCSSDVLLWMQKRGQ